MNKNEFYKEILSTYTIDAEKIKCNAKRGMARRNAIPFYKWAGIASAAMVAVAVGVVALSSVFSDKSISVVPKTDPETAIARMQAAENNYIASVLDNSEETVMYVSFSSPLSASEAFMVFSAISDSGDIRCELFYTTTNTVLPCDGEIADMSVQIAGAKVIAPAGYYKDIQNLKAISLVELAADGITDDTFIPLSTEDKESAATAGETTVPSDVEIILPDETTTADSTQETGTDTSDTGTATTDIGSETTPADTSAPDESVVASLDILNPLSVNFINDRTLVVTSDSTVELYRIGEDKTAVLDTKIYTNSPKLSWSSSDGTSLFITGCDQDGLRKKLYYANGASGTLSELDITTITADAELTALICCDNENAIIFKTVSLEKSKLYLATRAGNLLKTTLAAEYDGPISTLAYTNGILYYSTTDSATSAVTVYAKNIAKGTASKLAEFAGTVKFAKAYKFDRFAVFSDTDNSMLINGALVKTTATASLAFATLNSDIYSDDNGWHCISASGTVSISASDAAVYGAEALGSELYSAELSSTGVIIRSK